MKHRKLISLLPFLLSFSCLAASDNPVVNTTQYSVSIMGSRVVYNLDSEGAIFRVNNKQDYPILVRSRVLTESHKVNKDFIITPPLFRLSENNENTLQVHRIGGVFPDNKESLAWLCVKGIPPKEDDLWAEDNGQNDVRKKSLSINVNMSVETCIKMFIRPKSLPGTSIDYADKIKWKSEDGMLKAYNNSPFYINLTNVKVNGQEVLPDYVPPMSSKIIKTKQKIVQGMIVSWKAINDFGGNSNEFSAEVN
ncbi:molecular chaperone [Salmonella enterica]|nr:molecular chaperone [Salmonella enterica]